LTTPETSGALRGLKILGLGDLARYKAAVEAGQQVGWGYYFPYLLSRNRPGRSAVLLTEDEGSICVFLWRDGDSGPRLDLYFAPIPVHLPALERCLERANEFNGDFSARILRIDTKDTDVLSGLRHLRVKERRLQYIYGPRSFADIGGRKLRTLRRQVALVEELPNVEVQSYATDHAEACHALLRRWRKDHRASHGSAGGVGTTGRALDLLGQLSETDLRGEVVLVNGDLAAFALGGEIRRGVGCFFDAKCDKDVPGLSYFHRRSFLLRMQEFDLVNDGSDTGRAGLRQLKDSFRPVEMHAEHIGTQRSHRK